MPPDEVTICPPTSIPSRPCRYFIYAPNGEYAAAEWHEIDKNRYLGWMAWMTLEKCFGGEVAKVRLLAVEQPEQ